MIEDNARNIFMTEILLDGVMQVFLASLFLS